MSGGIAKAVAYYNPSNLTYVDKMVKSEYTKSLSQYKNVNNILALHSMLDLVCDAEWDKNH